MSELTAEQRQRMEENRRKAIERRAIKNQTQISGNVLGQQRSFGKSSHSAKTYPLFHIPTSNQKFPAQTSGVCAAPKESHLKSSTIQTLTKVPLFSAQTSKLHQNSNPNSSFTPSSSFSSNSASFYSDSKPISLTSSWKLLNLPKSSISDPDLILPAGSKIDSCNTNLQINPVNSSKPIKGTFVLLTRKRFIVEASYQQDMINIFKQIPSRIYDAKMKRWNFSIEDHDKLVTELKILPPHFTVLPLPRKVVKIFSEAPEILEIQHTDLSCLDPTLINALLPFQIEGVMFGIQHNGKVLIADDMGLGKTIQAIAICDYYKNDWPVLVVSPSSVKYSWVEAFRTWLPSLSHEVSVINTSKDYIPNDKVVVMSYELLSKKKDEVLNRGFKTIIMDESHFLKNPKTVRTKAALNVMKQMAHVILLSGTPALSRPIELYTQVSAIKPRNFPSYVEFGKRYCNGKRMSWGWDFTGSSNMGELRILLELVMIRRLKSEVIKQLPAKCRQMILLDPSHISTNSKKLAAMSRKMAKADFKGAERRGVLLEYFHETGFVKLKAICEYIKDLLEADRKFLCFGHHQVVLDGISKTIEDCKLDYIRIDGSTSSEQRKKLCDKFQLQDSCRVAVLSITAANAGITLTAAHLVIFAELFWNPGILNQAEDRAHRIGQKDSVVVQYLVAKGTADDDMWPLVQKKLDILNKAGLSKDNFKDADTVFMKNTLQPTIEEFWNELGRGLEAESRIRDDENETIPNKRPKFKET